jgi:quinoprotein glucose dehydrogenase
MLKEAETDSSAAVRLGVLLAYRHTRNPRIASFLGDSDAFNVREAAEAINDVPIEPALAPLAGKLASAPVKDEALVLRALNANFRLGDAPRAQAITHYALNEKATPEMRAEALKQLALWGKVPQRDRVVGIYRPMPERPATDAVTALSPVLSRLLDGTSPEKVQLAAIETAGALQLSDAAPTLAAAVANDKAPEPVRIAALRALDGIGGDEVLNAIGAAEKSNVPTLRLAALQIVARRAPERAIPVIKRFAASKLDIEQQAAFQAMGALPDAKSGPLLTAALDQLSAGKVAPAAQAELFEAVEKSAAPAVKARWENQQAAWAGGKDALAPYRYALEGGNGWRGSDQFYGNSVLPCARCHKAWGEGGEAGPDLSNIGAQRTAEYLLESIVKPSAHIAPGFDVVTFTMASGEVESGSVVSESDGQVVLRRGDGSQVTLDTNQVKERVTAPSSMPEIYQQVLTRQQMRDLVAFLRALDSSRSGEAEEPAFGVSNRAMQSVPREGAAGGHP